MPTAPRPMRPALVVPPRTTLQPHLYAAALAGHEPAEALTTSDRRRLVAQLHRAGWTDADIAVHTALTTYTAARIRDGLDLPPNTAEAAATKGAA
jgi:hypothetical protein